MLYAAFSLAVCAQADVGAWTSSVGMYQGDVDTLLIDNNRNLYALLRDLGVFKSQDGGNNWQSVNNNGLSGTRLLTMDARGNLYCLTDRGIAKSTDGGAHWIFSSFPTAAPPDKIYLHELNDLIATPSGTLFLAIDRLGVYKSDDGGANWVAANAGLPIDTRVNEATDPSSIRTFVVDVNGNIYAGNGARFGNTFVDANHGVYKSTDGGNSWIAVNTGLAVSSVNALSADAKGNVYVANDKGIYKSDNGGQLWTEIDKGIPTGYMSQVKKLLSPSNGKLYVQIEAKIGTLIGPTNSLTYVSHDSGGLWTVLDDGLPKALHALAIDFFSTAYAGTSLGIFKRAGDGLAWQPINSSLPSNSQVRFIAADANGSLYAIARSNNPYIETGAPNLLYKSVDHGINWFISNNGLPIGGVAKLAIGAGNILYAAALASSLPVIYRSVDSGANWVLTSITGSVVPKSSSISVLQASAQGDLYLVTNEGIFKSRDAGATWTAINNGLVFKVANAPEATAVYALAINGSGDIYAATDGGLYKSSNGGELWTLTADGLPNAGKVNYTVQCVTLRTYTCTTYPLPNVYNVVVDAEGRVYANTTKSVYKSSDGGASWQAANIGLPSGASGFSLSSAANGKLYVVDSEGRVYTSNDGAATWLALPNGKAPISVSAVIADSRTVITDSSTIIADSRGTLYAPTRAGVIQYTPMASTLAARDTTPYKITASAAGDNPALKLTANIIVASTDIGKTGKLYAVAILADGSAYVLSEQGWGAFNPAAVPAYATTKLGTHNLNLFDGSLVTNTGKLGISALLGATFYAGYGSDLDDMLSKKQYAAIYTVR